MGYGCEKRVDADYLREYALETYSAAEERARLRKRLLEELFKRDCP